MTIDTTTDQGAIDAIVALAVKDDEARQAAERRAQERRERERLARLAKQEETAAREYAERFTAQACNCYPPVLTWKAYAGDGAGPDAVAHLGRGLFLTYTVDCNEYGNVLVHDFAVVSADNPDSIRAVRNLPGLAAAIGTALGIAIEPRDGAEVADVEH